MSGLICPKCGKKSEDIEFIEAFCVECYPVNIKLPTKIELEQCKRCEKLKISGEWVPYSRKGLSEYVIGKCRGNFDEGEYLHEEGKISFTIAGKKNIKRKIIVEINPTICPYCSRISGGYFQGIIQLRGNKRKMEKYANLIVEKLEKKTFITKTEDMHEGVDIYVGSSKAIVELLSELKMKSLMTRKLVGVQHGKRVYRTTFLIRL